MHQRYFLSFSNYAKTTLLETCACAAQVLYPLRRVGLGKRFKGPVNKGEVETAILDGATHMHSSYHWEVANIYYSSRTELHALKGQHLAPNPCFPAPHMFCPAAAEPLPRLTPCLCQPMRGLRGPQDWGLQSFPTAGPMLQVAFPPCLCPMWCSAACSSHSPHPAGATCCATPGFPAV